MRRIYTGFLLLVICALFFKCQKDISHVGGPDSNPAVPNPITAIIQGNIVDEAGLPASGVTVRVGTQTTTTDGKGYFRLRNAALDKNASLVTAEKSGYFKAYRTFAATSGANQVMIKLVKRTLTGTVDAATGGTATLANGSKVTLPAGGVVIASGGAAYTGPVNVYASYIDPTAADIAETVPGSFIANDKTGNRVMLSSYGMMSVELESATGQKLQIKAGSKATLTAPIPSTILASAPASIPLWFVDETTGVWKEEGSATKQGNNYVGEVSHFSFWNYDISIPAVQLSLTLRNGEGQPVTHALVRITRTSMTSGYVQSYGYTDSLGQVSGLVPSNEPLLLEVLNLCYEPFYSQNIGPFSAATNLGIITVTSGGSSLVTFKGKLTTCSGTPVTSGYAIISYSNNVRYASVNSNGEYTTTFTRCTTSPSTADVIGVDVGASQQSPAATPVTIVTPTTNAPNIAACGTSTAQYINYTIDGTAYSLASPADSIIGYTMSDSLTAQLRTSISGQSLSGTAPRPFFDLQFVHPTPVAGTYAAVRYSTQVFPTTTITPPFNVVITNFASSVGTFYEGSFSGSFTAGGAVHTTSGTFRVRRNF